MSNGEPTSMYAAREIIENLEQENSDLKEKVEKLELQLDDAKGVMQDILGDIDKAIKELKNG